MNSFKFRLWDIDSKSFSYFDLSSGSGRNAEGLLKYFCAFTGIPDKNQKEIFHKDIVKFKPFTNEEEKIGVVDYNEGFAAFLITIWDEDVKDFLSIGMNKFNTYEVIGNIFESPELLRIKKSCT